MELVDAHNEAYADTASVDQPRASTKDPFSLEGLPQGNAADLFDVARKVNGVRKPDGTVVK